MLPNFGPYKEEKNKKLAVKLQTTDLLADEFKPQTVRPALDPSIPVPKIKVNFKNLCWNILHTNMLTMPLALLLTDLLARFVHLLL